MEETTNINKSLKEKYRNEVVKGLTQEIHRLDSCHEFVREDSFHGYETEDHIMYKLGTLYSEDGCRAYEFLFEFDKKDYEYGIYFGCKGLIFDGNVLEQILKFDQEWSTVKERIINKLNRTFRSNDFNKRIRLTNNCNDFTYWPFWIRLYEDEDITTKGQKMLSIIREMYKKDRHLTEVASIDQYHKSGPTRSTQKAPTTDAKWYKLPFKDGWADKTREVLSTFLQGNTDDTKKRRIVVAIYIVLHAIAYKDNRERDRAKFARALSEIAPDFCKENNIKDYIDEFYSYSSKHNDLYISEVFDKPFTSDEEVKPDKDKSIEGYIRNSCLKLYGQEGRLNLSEPCKKAISGITEAAKKIYNALI